jgi:hypothetical protein
MNANEFTRIEENVKGLETSPQPLSYKERGTNLSPNPSPCRRGEQTSPQPLSYKERGTNLTPTPLLVGEGNKPLPNPSPTRRGEFFFLPLPLQGRGLGG